MCACESLTIDQLLFTTRRGASAPGYSGRAAAAMTQTVWRPGAQAGQWSRHTIVLIVQVWSAHQPLSRGSSLKQVDKLTSLQYKIL